MKIDGLLVIDATRSVHIHITPEDVKRGGMKKPESCAAARACIRDLDMTAARVHLSRIYLQKGSKWIRYLTPQALKQEIIAFDRGGTFTAGDYTLSPMPASGRLGTYHKGKHPSRRSRNKKAQRHMVVGVRPAASKGHGA